MSSLMNLILGQKAIILSLGIALLLLVAAVVLMVVFRVRNRPARPPRPKAQYAEAIAEPDETPVAAIQGESRPAPVQAATVPAARQPEPAPNKDAPAEKAKPPERPGTPPTPAPAAEATAAHNPGDAMANAMQDLLSSVFVDEAASARIETLLRGCEHIEITDLAALCSQIAGQLHSRTQTVTTGGKEA